MEPAAPKAGPIVIPYPNTGFASNLAKGSSTVFICGTEVALKDVSYLANSTGNRTGNSSIP
ncbi:PAAR-like domain-containing protein [Chitinibacter mangrovi]|uniref:PAAR-like domain-containing protein n=1 Tax=Chitinibacter mangrovi TaxID=3153927 RepID=UPI003D8148DA